MGKISTIINTTKNEGISDALVLAGKYTLTSSPVAPYLRYLFGKELHQQLYMYMKLGYWPNIQEPRTFNEKIMNRKLYSNKNIFSVVEDKWRARKYVEEKVSEDILPEIYYVSDDPGSIPFEDFPSRYVIKPTHLSGGENFIIDGKSAIDENYIKNTCIDWLNQTRGEMLGEYWYKNIEPRIIVEEYIDSTGSKAPVDYKFMVFHGDVKIIHVTYNRYDDTDTKRNFYDEDWNPIDVELHFPKGNGLSKPKNLDRMIEISEKLGEEFDHIRVDLYSPDQNNIYFGEFTVAESSGGNRFVPRKYDFKFGTYW